MEKLYVIDLDKEGLYIDNIITFSSILKYSENLKDYLSTVWTGVENNGKITLTNLNGNIQIEDFPFSCLYEVTNYKDNGSFGLVKEVKFSINDFIKFKKIEPEFELLKDINTDVYVVGPVSNCHHDGYLKAIVEIQNFENIELKYLKIPHVFF